MNGKPRVVYVHDAPMPSQAANVVQVVKMCGAFSEAGADVTLFAPRNPDLSGTSFENLRVGYGLSPSAFRVHNLRVASAPGRMQLLGTVGALCAGRNGSSVLYTRSISAAAAAMRIGRRVGLEMHLPLSAYGEKGNRLRLRAHKLALLVVISERLREDFEREIPLLEGRVLVAHDGADDHSSRPAPAAVAGAFRVGYVGHLYAGKGMEIISRLIPMCPWATFHIIGGSSPDLEQWRNRVNASTNAIFHGHVPHAQTPSYIAAMDVVLAPYQRIVRSVGGQDVASWMSPLKLFEYMANAKAIVASDLPVIREVLEDGVTAWLRDPDDLQAWASALRSLHDRPELRSALGERAREAFLSKHTWLQRARGILDALRTGSGASVRKGI